MEKVTFQAESTRHLQEVEKVKETQGEEPPSDQCVKPWSNHEIRSFLQEWELLEGEELKNYHLASRIIARHLKQRGINKSRRKCLQMLINMQDLYWTIHEANQRPRSEPLPCPYGEALHRILEHRGENKDFSEVADVPPPEYQPPACAIPDCFEELLWAPPHNLHRGSSGTQMGALEHEPSTVKSMPVSCIFLPTPWPPATVVNSLTLSQIENLQLEPESQFDSKDRQWTSTILYTHDFFFPSPM
ncbi:putative uncharacterized protein MSANTD5 [Mesoplodon densirostris]|uniref:putative uncharacterized protein MSANTD5 n=1 Tax=Mesoplodon densirostris TaxID=48708 RepID=UPI0028DCF1A8|nr:putative uncharacterized protein MSANTD5 [Mesoplodon densirostris]